VNDPFENIGPSTGKKAESFSKYIGTEFPRVLGNEKNVGLFRLDVILTIKVSFWKVHGVMYKRRSFSKSFDYSITCQNAENDERFLRALENSSRELQKKARHPLDTCATRVAYPGLTVICV